MREAAVEFPGEKCPRCLESVPRKAERCPHCRQPLGASRRMVALAAVMTGAVLLVLLAVVMYRVGYLRDGEPAPAVESAPAADAPFPAAPETSAEHETPAPDPNAKPPAPPEPEKKPPLNR